MLVAIYSSRLTENERKKCQKNTLLEKDLLDGFLIPSYAYFIKENFENRSRIDKILLLKFLSRNNFHFFHIKLILSIFSKFFEEKYLDIQISREKNKFPGNFFLRESNQRN